MKENIETKDVQRTEYLDKNGLDMLWAKVKENTRNQVEVERDRATTQENRIIETKADKSELHSSYVSNSTFTALQEKVAANTDAINDKQDAGNYLHYGTLNNEGYYEIPSISIVSNGGNNKTDIDSQSISVKCDVPDGYTTITCDGISNNDNNANHVFATDGSIADLTQYAKKADIPAVDTSDFVSKTTTDAQSIKSELSVSNILSVVNSSSSEPLVMIETDGDDSNFVMINPKNEEKVIWVTPTHIQIGKDLENSMFISRNSIQSPDNDMQHVFTTAGTIANLNEYVRKENIGDGLNINDDGVVSVDTTAISGGNVDDVQVNGVSVVENKIANIKPATKEGLGVVKVGDGLNVTDGVISVSAGNYLTYDSVTNESYYISSPKTFIFNGNDQDPALSIGNNHIIVGNNNTRMYSKMLDNYIELRADKNALDISCANITGNEYKGDDPTPYQQFVLNKKGVWLYGGDNNHVLTSNASTIDITQYVLKSVYDEKIAALEARIAALEAKHAEAAQ